MNLRIVTYNIHKGVLGVRRPRLTIHELRSQLHLLRADLVFLQEVQGDHARHANRFSDWPQQGQHEFLAQPDAEIERLLGHQSKQYFTAYGMNAVYPHGHHGNALLSAYPVRWKMNEDVSDHRLEQRGILHCQLDTPKGAIHCMVVHFGLLRGSRRRQAIRLIEHAARHVPSNAPLIVAGDFNDWQRGLGSLLTDGLRAQEVLPTGALGKRFGFASFPSRLPILGLDRVFVRGFNVETAQVQSEPVWAGLSDHAPLVVELSCQFGRL